MITKQPKNNNDEDYEVKVTDKNGKSFIMTIGENYDLYWYPEYKSKTRSYEIDKNDTIAFCIFNQLFDDIKINDDKYRPVLNGNQITFVSEDYHEDEANVLNIIKNDNYIAIEFLNNQNVKKWSCPHIGSSICFCNSGSRVPEVEQIFLKMFRFLAYENKLIQSEIAEDKEM